VVTGVLAVELAARGIRVNQINLGAVDSEGARAIGAMSDPSARRAHRPYASWKNGTRANANGSCP